MLESCRATRRPRSHSPSGLASGGGPVVCVRRGDRPLARASLARAWRGRIATGRTLGPERARPRVCVPVRRPDRCCHGCRRDSIGHRLVGRSQQRGDVPGRLLPGAGRSGRVFPQLRVRHLSRPTGDVERRPGVSAGAGDVLRRCRRACGHHRVRRPAPSGRTQLRRGLLPRARHQPDGTRNRRGSSGVSWFSLESPRLSVQSSRASASTNHQPPSASASGGDWPEVLHAGGRLEHARLCRH